ncbi:TPA: hypothetical protein P2N00_004408 [Aeromonas salmonicida]|jgi:hypothetical protein|nr:MULTISPECIES: hypothetical protein [Aeromonas]EKP0241649.1 hypothetical protein [Aeromonas salmonicida]EKP0245749.1 hypothetical protein [Aeromonas salmonicida]EKP0254348.1 hypothetical protein [Aeromonas salmonicida]EKP0271397.1 hypothetical protein [Aeromonas salmonicida]EKP0284581.1 hypothetical protein [Aeromonas salmonicida]
MREILISGNAVTSTSRFKNMSDNERPNIDQLLAGFMGPLSDMGPADPQSEGSYRRGYHQAVAMIFFHLNAGKPLTCEQLSEWVENDGMSWRHDMDLKRKIIAPDLK